MRWKLQIAENETVDVSLLKVEDTKFTFKVGGETVEIESPKNYKFSIHSGETRVELESWNADRWKAYTQGRTYSIHPIQQGEGSQNSSKQIKTLMPGRVLKILVNEGEKVKSGQTLLVLEAMKMENEIRATADSEVLQIHVKPGQSLEAGSILIEMK